MEVVRTCRLEGQRNPNTGQESHSPGDSGSMSALLGMGCLGSSLKNIGFYKQTRTERVTGTEKGDRVESMFTAG